MQPLQLDNENLDFYLKVYISPRVKSAFSWVDSFVTQRGGTVVSPDAKCHLAFLTLDESFQTHGHKIILTDEDLTGHCLKEREFLFDPKEVKELDFIIREIYDLSKKEAALSHYERALKEFKNQHKKLSSIVSTWIKETPSEIRADYFNKCCDISFQSFSSKNTSDFIDKLTPLFNELNIEIHKEKDSFFNFNEKLFYPVWDEEYPSYLIIQSEEMSDEIKLLINYFFQELSEIKQLQEGRESNEESFEMWKELFDTLPYPVALVSKKGEFLLHSSNFHGLGLFGHECLELQDGQSLEKNKSLWRVRKKEVLKGDDRLEVIVFFPNEIEGSDNIFSSTEHLGIISSSIAHELNNPIGGMLAALDLILLDELSSEQEQSILEMKEGVTRCRELIRIFLGFSRVSLPSQVFGSLGDAYSNAFNLMRFRIVESGIKLNFDYQVRSSYENEVNLPLYTMIFYLFFSEYYTQLSHQNLIEKLDNDKVQIIENQKGLVIKGPFLKEVLRALRASKLIEHLVKGNDIDITLEGDSIQMQLSSQSEFSFE